MKTALVARPGDDSPHTPNSTGTPPEWKLRLEKPFASRQWDVVLAPLSCDSVSLHPDFVSAHNELP